MSGLWLLQLQPASWRGVGFAVDSSEYRRGRRTAVHEYPFRDSVWVEDLGRGVRTVSFSGFVVGDTCYTQAQSLIAQAEKAGPGPLVHPSLGQLSVALVGPLECRERKDLGRVVEIQFEFVEAGQAVFPAGGILSQIRSGIAAVAADVAAVTDFIDNIRSAITQGLQVITMGFGLVESWTNRVLNLGNDAALLVHSVTGLAGNFGRFSLGAAATLLADATDPLGAIAAVLAGQQRVASAGTAASALMGSLSLNGTTDNGFGAAVQSVTEALRSVAVDPADAVRLLTGLASYSTGTPAQTVAPVGSAIAAMQTGLGQLFRRASLTSLARATADYQPSSYDDAVTVRSTVAAAFDAEILNAADAGQDASYQALRTLRASVVDDLTTRGQDLPHLATVTTRLPTPALTLAYRLYDDASRCDDIAARAAAPHPAFLPIAFKALSS